MEELARIAPLPRLTRRRGSYGDQSLYPTLQSLRNSAPVQPAMALDVDTLKSPMEQKASASHRNAQLGTNMADEWPPSAFELKLLASLITTSVQS